MTERCPKCLNERHAGDEQCPKCGIIFSKFDPEEYKELLARREALRRQAIARIRPDKHAPLDAPQTSRPVGDGLGQRLKKKTGIRPGIWLLVLIVFSPVIWAILTEGPRSGQSGGRNTCTRDYAFVMSQSFVEDRLKAPSSAKFPWMHTATIIDQGAGKFVVSSYVDSQNSFGAMLRSNYSATLTCSGNDWRLVDLTIR